MNDRGYASRTATLAEFKPEIICIFEETDVAMLQLVIQNLLMPLEKVTEIDSVHIKNVLY